MRHWLIHDLLLKQHVTLLKLEGIVREINQCSINTTKSDNPLDHVSKRTQVF